MNKILTIVIPTYNMEKYLRRCLDSLIVSETIMESLEVLIINDGSKDSSLDIAHEYEKKDPQTFRVIDKENGNYGSCVNRGLKEANGKYFRILDADDFFKEGALQEVLIQLEALQEDVDVIHTDYQIIYTEEDRIRCVVNDKLKYNTVIDLYNEPLPNLVYENFAMHALMYNTNYLRTIKYVQQEGISYTDSEYVYYPFSVAKTFMAFNIILYCYNVGREGQTVSVESMIKNRDNYSKLFNRYIQDKNYLSGNLAAILVRRIILALLVSDMLRIYIKYSSYNKETEQKLRHVLKQVKEQDVELYRKIVYKRVNGIYPYKIWKMLGKFWFFIYRR